MGRNLLKEDTQAKLMSFFGPGFREGEGYSLGLVPELRTTCDSFVVV